MICVKKKNLFSLMFTLIVIFLTSPTTYAMQFLSNWLSGNKPSLSYSRVNLFQELAIKPQQGTYPVYWLDIPQLNDAVLIQMHEHHEQPTIDTQTHTANFSFIDPTIFSANNKRFNLLPSGLYMWKSIIAKAKNPHALGSFVVKSSPTSNGSFALAQTGEHKWGYIPAIPVKKEYIWTSDPQYIEKSPIEYLIGNKHKHFMTIASCNLLFEDFYTKYGPQTPQDRMPAEDRAYFFYHAFQAGGIFYDTDILCFQEWKTNDIGKKTTLERFGYTIVEPTFSQKNTAATAIAYKKTAFTVQHQHQFNLDSKICVEAILQHNKNPHTHLHVVSAHVPSKPAHQLDQQLVLIASLFKQKKQALSIVCGDFNYNIYGPKNGAPQITSLRQQPTNEKPYAQLKKLAALEKFVEASEQNNRLFYPTAFDNGFTKIDYMWYTPKVNNHELDCKNVEIYPLDLKKLIKHTQPHKDDGQYFNNYFSDHAVIKGYFSLR